LNSRESDTPFNPQKKKEHHLFAVIVNHCYSQSLFVYVFIVELVKLKDAGIQERGQLAGKPFILASNNWNVCEIGGKSDVNSGRWCCALES
jgi:hypothetical protein